MPEIIQEWLGTRLGIILDLSPQKFGRNTKDGTILAKLLYSYGVIPQHVFENVQESKNYHDCHKNLMELKPWLDYIGVTNEDLTLQKMAGGEGSAAISIFYSVYLNLERKDRLYYLSAQKERRFSEDTCHNKFRVDWVPETEIRKESEVEFSKYILPLVYTRDLVTFHKEKCKQVVNILKATKKKFEKTMRRDLKPGPVIPTRPTLPPVDRHLKEAEETKEEIRDFEKRHWKDGADLTYSQLIEMKNAKEGKPCFLAPNLTEAENIVNNIRGRKRREVYAKNFLQKMQFLALDETWKEITEKQDKGFENTVCEFLLKQSQYEKQMAGKLHLIRNQKKVLAENRRKIECLKLEQGEKEFDDLVGGKMEKRGENWEEEEFEQKRIAELHRRIYDKKVKMRSMLLANETRRICDALVDIAIRISEARAVTACQLPKSFIKDLKELFYKGFPITDVLENFEELYVKGTKLSEEKQETFNQNEELEKMRNEEKEKQAFLNECDFQDYLNLFGPWMAQLFFPDGSETEPKHAVLGYVVHKLLAAKYPVPNLPVPVPIKAMKPAAVVLGLGDDSAYKMLEDLMETRGILVVNVDDAINFVLAAYKKELSVVSDIDINFRQVTANSLKDKKICDQEKEKKKVRLLKKEKPENEVPVQDEPPQMDKETQTPRKIPEDVPFLSSNAITGKQAFEALGVGDPVPDSVIISAIVAYIISKQDNYDGCVILNYPLLYGQASELECALRGFRTLPIINDMESMEEVEGFTFRESCVNPFVKDRDTKNHLSRLVPQPPDNTQPPDEVSKTYFDTFVVMKKIANSSESHEPEGEMGLMERFYFEQDILFNFEYQSLNFQSIKNLAKTILGQVFKTDEITPKTSVEIFGDAILELNEKWESNKKTAKPKETVTKKVTKDSPEFRSTEVFDFLGEMRGEETSDKRIPDSLKSLEKQAPPPKPGDPEWEWATGSLPKQIQIILASLWESMETVYVEDFHDVFFFLRVHRSKVFSYSSFIRQSTKTLIKGPDAKQKVLSDFQQMFNGIDEDLRPDVDVKCELHVRVSELEQALMSIADERRASFLKDLKKIAKDSWVADEMAILVNAYLTAVQLEADRCVDTCQVIMDYYLFLQQKVPSGDPLGRVAVPKLQTVEGRYSTKSNKISSPRPSDPRRSSKPSNDKVSRTRSLTEKRKRTAEGSLLAGAAEAITSILVDLTLPADGLTPFHTYFLDIGDLVTGEVRNIVDFCLNEAKRGEKPPQKNGKKGPEVKPPASSNLCAEWVSALETELDRFVFRMKLILAKGLFEMNEFLTMILNVISSLSEDITDMYLREIKSISECCKVFRCGIEEEIGIQPQLELRAEEFIVNQDILLFPKSQEAASSSVEDEQKKYRFTIEQLSLLFKKLQHVAPEGEIVKRSLVYIFEDLRTLNPEIENGNCFPEVWGLIEPDDITFVLNEMYQELEIVSWKDFIVCAIDLPMPTESEILSMRKMFRSFDPLVSELITRENYDSVKFWFDTTLDYYTKVDRCEKAKDLLYRMYQVDELRTNYSALLLAFCKDENPIFGFAKALALIMGKKISLRESFGDYMSIEGEGARHDFAMSDYDSDRLKKMDFTSTITTQASRRSSFKIKKYGKDSRTKSSTTEDQDDELSFSENENVGENMSLYRYDLPNSRRSSAASCVPYDMLTALFKAAYPSLPQLSVLLDCKQTFEETLNSIYDNLETRDGGVEVLKLVQHNFVSQLLQSTNKFKLVKISRILMQMAAIKNDAGNCPPDKLNFKFCAN